MRMLLTGRPPTSGLYKSWSKSASAHRLVPRGNQGQVVYSPICAKNPHIAAYRSNRSIYERNQATDRHVASCRPFKNPSSPNTPPRPSKSKLAISIPSAPPPPNSASPSPRLHRTHRVYHGGRERFLYRPQAIAASPLRSTNDSNFSDAPAGFFCPRSHWLTESFVTFR